MLVQQLWRKRNHHVSVFNRVPASFKCSKGNDSVVSIIGHVFSVRPAHTAPRTFLKLKLYDSA
jgi:hypothetical protein